MFVLAMYLPSCTVSSLKFFIFQGADGTNVLIFSSISSIAKMKSMLISAVIGVAALTVQGVGAAAIPVNGKH